MRKIGKCGSCKQTSARDYNEFKNETVNPGTIYERVAKMAGRTNRFGRFVKASKDLECGHCGQYTWNGKMVEGVVTDHVCDARCTEAKGFRCECSCGGKNHGQRFVCT